MHVRHPMLWKLRVSLLLMLLLGSIASASANNYYKISFSPATGGARFGPELNDPCSYNLPYFSTLVIYYDYGWQPGNYTNTEVRYWYYTDRSQSSLFIPISTFRTKVYVRGRILRSDGVWEITPEVSGELMRFWGGGSSGGCAS